MKRPHQTTFRFKAAPTTGLPFAEFFAGIGLVRMGLEQAGWKVAYANDNDPRKFDIYDGHFGDAADHFVVDDLRAVKAETIPDVLLATASFPCTDLSIAGGRRGIHRGESSAFWAFVQVLAEMAERRPKLILLENVTGFLTSHDGADFRNALLALNELGYVVDAFVLDARWFVPQSRPRLFVVGRLEATADHPPAPVESRLRPKTLIEAIGASANQVQWAIADLPDPPAASPLGLPDILEDVPPDAPIWWTRVRAEYLYGQMSERHRAIADHMIRKRVWSYGTVFRRVRRQPDGVKRSMAELRTDGIAGCLRTPKGGSGRQILWKAGYNTYHARLLTPTECARLMGAGDFNVSGSLNDALFGFGDAVCVPAIRWIAEHYLNPAISEHQGVDAPVALRQ